MKQFISTGVKVVLYYNPALLAAIRSEISDDKDSAYCRAQIPLINEICSVYCSVQIKPEAEEIIAQDRRGHNPYVLRVSEAVDILLLDKKSGMFDRHKDFWIISRSMSGSNFPRTASEMINLYQKAKAENALVCSCDDGQWRGFDRCLQDVFRYGNENRFLYYIASSINLEFNFVLDNLGKNTKTSKVLLQ